MSIFNRALTGGKPTFEVSGAKVGSRPQTDIRVIEKEAPTLEQFKEIDLPFVPDAGAPNPVLLQTDDSAALLFGARERLANREVSEVVGHAIVRFPICHSTKFGYSNDEAMTGIPRFRGSSYGAYEITDSSWIDEMRELNRHSFPDTPCLVGAKHFVLVFHDSTFECVGNEIEAEFSHERWESLWARIYQRQLRYAGE